MNSQFENALAHGGAIAEIAQLNVAQPRYDSCLRPLVAQGGEPIVKWTPSVVLLEQNEFDHGVSVA